MKNCSCPGRNSNTLKLFCPSFSCQGSEIRSLLLPLKTLAFPAAEVSQWIKMLVTWPGCLSPIPETQTQVDRENKFHKNWPLTSTYTPWHMLPQQIHNSTFKKQGIFPVSSKAKEKTGAPGQSHEGEGLVSPKRCLSHLSHLLAGETGAQIMMMGGMDHSLPKDWKTALYFKLKLLPNPKYWTWLPTEPLSSSFPVW